MNPIRLKSYILFTLVALIWGVAGPVIKYTLDGLSWDVFLFYRLYLSSLVAILILIIIKFKLPKNFKIIFQIIAYSVLTSTAALGLLFLGLEKTTALDMSIISLTGPIFITIVGSIFLKERITKKEKLGIAITVFGSTLIVLEPLFTNGYSFGKIEGNLLILASSVANAISILFLKKLLRNKINPLAISSFAFIIGFLTLAPFVLYFRGLSQTIVVISSAKLGYHLGVFFMAFVSGTLAYTISNIAQKSIEISEASIFTYLQPLFAAPLAIFWLQERIDIYFVIGSLIIILGVIIAEYKTRQKRIAS